VDPRQGHVEKVVSQPMGGQLCSVNESSLHNKSPPSPSNSQSCQHIKYSHRRMTAQGSQRDTRRSPRQRWVFQVPNLNSGSVDDEYQFGARLAPKVFEVRNKITGVISVCYKCPKRISPCSEGEKISDIIKKLQSIEHPNLSVLMEAFDDPRFVHVIYVHAKSLPLFAYCERCKDSFSEQTASSIILQLVRVVSVCDSYNFVHGLLVPKNILVQKEHTHVYVTNLGIAGVIKPHPYMTLATKDKATVQFIAPELLGLYNQKLQLRQKHQWAKVDKVTLAHPDELPRFTVQSDLWSIAILTWCLLKGDFALDMSGSLGDVMTAIVGFNEESIKPALSHAGEDARSFVAAVAKRDPNERPSCVACLNLPFLRNTKRQSCVPFGHEIIGNIVNLQKPPEFKQFVFRFIVQRLPLTKQIKAVVSVFDMCDADASGTLAVDELKDYVKENITNFQEKVDLNRLDEAFELLDADGSNTISINEFIQAVLLTSGALEKNTLLMTFQQMDLERDGLLTMNEVEPLVREIEAHMPVRPIEETVLCIQRQIGSGIDFRTFVELMTLNQPAPAGPSSISMLCPKTMQLHGKCLQILACS